MADPEKRFVIEYGDYLDRRVGRAPERERGDFLTRSEAAIRIIDEMDAAIAIARDSRRRAMRVLWAERRKALK
jgi:hypothetical protein